MLLALAAPVLAADNLRLNPNLNYNSDSQDGPLIMGDDIGSGFLPGKPAYIIMYGEGCYNSKRQARRTVELYEKYKSRVQFIVIDTDQPRSPAQGDLLKRYFRNYIPHVVALDASGLPLYNASGEVDSAVISRLLDKSLR
jgi:hypothetical protein